MPRARQLPNEIQQLARKSSVALRRDEFKSDIDKLVMSLQGLSPAPTLKMAGVASDQSRSDAIEAQGVELLSGRWGEAGCVFRDRGVEEASSYGLPELVTVPVGEFLMGSQRGGLDERPVHRVRFARPFAVGRYPVTFAEWDAFVAAGGSRYLPADQGWGRQRRPVINVSWDDAQSYVAWLSRRAGHPYRLLSEAEWEYAARAGSRSEVATMNEANHLGSGSRWSGDRTAPVGSFSQNGFRIYDMLGNVWEWTADCWNETYKGAPADGSAWTSGDCSLRVMRGGSFSDASRFARPSVREASTTEYSANDVGLRVARVL